MRVTLQRLTKLANEQGFNVSELFYGRTVRQGIKIYPTSTARLKWQGGSYSTVSEAWSKLVENISKVSA